MSRPTIADLAVAANVSVSTVDRILNGRDPVRKVTAELVLKAAERIGYHGTAAIRHRLANGKPVRRLGFLLQQRGHQEYRLWGDSLAEATRACSLVHGRPIVRYLDDLSAENIIDNLIQLSREVDALAVVALDQPLVHQAVESLTTDGLPVFSFVTDLTPSGQSGHVGVDNLKKGGTAAWFITHMCRKPGKVALLVGSQDYLSQSNAEIGFRAHFRGKRTDFEVLETVSTLEDDQRAYELTEHLLKHTRDLVGLYLTGGGIAGFMRALRDHGSAEQYVAIGNELTEETRSALTDCVLDVVLSHPPQEVAALLVDAMADASLGKGRLPVRKQILPFDIHTATNI